MAEAIVSHHAQHADATHAQSREIIGDGATGSGGDFGPDHADARDASFAGGIGDGWIVGTPAVQADVADHQRGELREFSQNLWRSCMF